MKHRSRGLQLCSLVLLGWLVMMSHEVMASDNQVDQFLRDETNVSIEHLGRDIGLSSLSVSSIVQDKYGFIWFGTQDGLNRYDGREMTVIKKDLYSDGRLINNLIQTMVYDEERHELLIGTYGGLSIYDIEKDVFTNFGAELFPDAVIIAIEQREDGTLWLGTFDGVIKLNPETGEMKHYPVKGNTVRDFLVDSEGRLLIGTLDGLYSYDETEDLLNRIHLDLPSPYVMVVEELDEGIITLGMWFGGVETFDLDFNRLSHQSYGDDQIYKLFKTNDETLWVATWNNGLFATTSEEETYHFPKGEDEQSISHSVVYSFMEDQSHILWVGTNGGGVNKINPRKRDYLRYKHSADDPNSLDAGKINTIYQDQRGDYWVAVYNSGINRINTLTGEITKYKNNPKEEHGLSGNQIMDILQLDEDHLALATENGIDVYSYAEDQFSRLMAFHNHSVYSLELTPEGVLWIGTHDNGLFQLNIKTNTLKPYRISDKLVYDILYDREGRLWVGTNNGLNLLEKGATSFVAFHSEEANVTQLASDTIHQIYEDQEGRIWIATSEGGIAKYVPESKSFISYTEEKGLSSNNVTSIVESNQNMIWVGTNDGLSAIKTDTDEITIMTPEDGIGGWEFNSGVLKDINGDLLFGGLHGITAIPENYTVDSGYDIQVYITDVKIFNESINPLKLSFNDMMMDLQPKERFVSFDFIALDYEAPERVIYYYMLEGVDQTWNQTKTELKATYANLPPGVYTFRVQARGIGSGISQAATVSLTIMKPWYLQWYAFILYAFAFVVLAYFFSKIREARIMKGRNLALDLLNHQLEEANNALEQLSIKDALTDLYNRRFMDLKLEEQLHLAVRSQTNLSLIMVDVDLFKDINDRYGHLLGDQYLKDIADVLMTTLQRSTDIAVRYGGDEFILVLYDASIDGAMLVANRIQHKVEELCLNKDFLDMDIRTTVSIGLISLVPDQDVKPKDLIEAVDQALYRAKSQGRDQICIGRIPSRDEA